VKYPTLLEDSLVWNKIVVNNKLFFVFFGMAQGVIEILTEE